MRFQPLSCHWVEAPTGNRDPPADPGWWTGEAGAARPLGDGEGAPLPLILAPGVCISAVAEAAPHIPCGVALTPHSCGRGGISRVLRPRCPGAARLALGGLGGAAPHPGASPTMGRGCLSVGRGAGACLLAAAGPPAGSTEPPRGLPDRSPHAHPWTVAVLRAPVRILWSLGSGRGAWEAQGQVHWLPPEGIQAARSATGLGHYRCDAVSRRG